MGKETNVSPKSRLKYSAGFINSVFESKDSGSALGARNIQKTSVYGRPKFHVRLKALFFIVLRLCHVLLMPMLGMVTRKLLLGVPTLKLLLQMGFSSTASSHGSEIPLHVTLNSSFPS